MRTAGIVLLVFQAFALVGGYTTGNGLFPLSLEGGVLSVLAQIIGYFLPLILGIAFLLADRRRKKNIR